VFHEFIRATVVCISLVHDVLADLIETFGDAHVQVEQFVHDLFIYLSILVVHLLLSDELQVVWQVKLVPWVILYLLESDSLHGIWL